MVRCPSVGARSAPFTPRSSPHAKATTATAPHRRTEKKNVASLENRLSPSNCSMAAKLRDEAEDQQERQIERARVRQAEKTRDPLWINGIAARTAAALPSRQKAKAMDAP